MRKGIHPEYHECTVKCVCGNEFTTRSTLKEINVEICSACHPFFSGQQKLVDSAGRVDRFLKKYGSEFGGALVEGSAVSREKSAAEKPSSDAGTADEKPSDADAADEKPSADN
jgi:large subunit ribosomal protein L31